MQAIAAAGLDESEVAIILSDKGTAPNRKDMKLEVKWTDDDITWEPLENVKRLEVMDFCIEKNPTLKPLKK